MSRWWPSIARANRPNAIWPLAPGYFARATPETTSGLISAKLNTVDAIRNRCLEVIQRVLRRFDDRLMAVTLTQ